MPEDRYLVKPEHLDQIWKIEAFIKELSKVQDRYFEELVKELGITERAEDFLFDYMFNDYPEHEDFEHHLEQYGFDEKVYN